MDVAKLSYSPYQNTTTSSPTYVTTTSCIGRDFAQLSISEQGQSQVSSMSNTANKLKPISILRFDAINEALSATFGISTNITEIISIYDDPYGATLEFLRHGRVLSESFKSTLSEVTELDLISRPILENMTQIFLLFKNVTSLYYKKNEFHIRGERFKHFDYPDLAFSDFDLVQHKNLQVLDLYFCKGITDTLLGLVGRFDKLLYLNLYGCNIDNECVREIVKFRRLMYLNLSFNSEITDYGLDSISQLTELQSLFLSGCHKITLYSLVKISQLDNLEQLDLSSCKVNNTGLTYISQLTNLKILSLSFNDDITDDGIQSIAGIVSIEELELACCDEITDQSLYHVADITNIKILDVTGCNKITTNGVKQLLEALAIKVRH